MISRKIFLLVLLSFNFKAFTEAQVPGFFMKEEARKVRIPFYSSNSLIILPVSINGSESINFLVDTGVRSNILFSKTLGDALGLDYTRRLSIAGADGSTVIMAQVSPINTLDLGPIVGRMQSLLVLEQDFFELESVIGVPVYGIIGYEFFKFNPVKINYDEGFLEFYRENSIKWKPPFYRKFDMAIEDSKAYIEAKINQKSGPKIKAKLLIDTGANHGLLLNQETSDEIKMPPLFIESQLGQSLGGVLYGYIGRVNSLNLNGLNMKEVLTSYPDKNTFSDIIVATGRQGSLGSEVLGRTRMILDYQRKRALIRKGENFYSPFEYDMSGLILRKIPNDENRYYVSDVRLGSPAYKTGILPYDELLSVNKIPTFLWELSELFKLLRSEEGKEIQLEMRRYQSDDLTEFDDYKVSIFLKKQI
ncbi:MAG: aspartyl protease family protein [Algoriphagus sp.]|jgi:predicted aspartyl protease|uniref:aspartyl protease family protein n=1 Tax=Algoriphagus sp. TaxID=1872435 RepID=UPI002717D6A4|nr:aspartyl protease family protein [Algoriphagus sp.]MDO8967719.1 aspartyl protease family protein [Algoriphagus sp.]MDP2041912.1 aspartyl protease family protein [Algoriphagus sp.]MDP3200003.1 aspartyl protease family protein [Algoriphagus sp.]MDP3472663.1 aspartyl protease family protein [Algoriphagus sp.]